MVSADLLLFIICRFLNIGDINLACLYRIVHSKFIFGLFGKTSAIHQTFLIKHLLECFYHEVAGSKAENLI
jgi:hypothetical protein